LIPIQIQSLRKQLWQNGFRPINVKTASKVPLPKERWTERARTNPPEAATAWPSADALSTGILCDGLIALDIDTDDPAIVSQIASAAKQYLGDAPSRTRGDSPRCLYLYRAAEGEPSKRSLSGKRGKVEALGHGQQFVAFGNHPDGAVYDWPEGSPASFHRDKLSTVTQDALHAFLCAVAPLIGAEMPQTASAHPEMPVLPIAGQAVAEREREYANTALEAEIGRLTAMQPGSGRNAALNTSAHSLGTMIGAGWLNVEVVADALLQAASANGHTAKHGIAQTKATIESGVNAGMAKPRAPLQSEVIPQWLRDAVARWIAEYKAKHSSKPEKAWLAPINQDAYIGIAGEFIRLVAPQTEGDPNALLIAFLTVIGSLIGRGAFLRLGATCHYGNLFSVIVAETSKGRKGTVMAEAKRFAKMIDPTIAARMLGGLSSGEGLIEAVRDARLDNAPVEQGKMAVSKVIDNGVSDKRLLVTESEMGQALQAAGRDGNTLSAVLRMSWDGDELRTLARSNKNVCREPHISIFGNITLDELQRLLTSTDRTNGFANRFLWVCAKRSQELPFGGHADESALQALAAKAARAIDCSTYYGECGWLPDAASLWAREYSRLSSSTPGLAGAMSARAETQTLRIALIYAVLDGCNNVDVHHLRAALEVWRYCQDSVGYCFAGTIANTTADRIASMLAGMTEGASLTQISNYFGRNKKTAELQRALATLKESGKARCETHKTAGRAAEVWFAC
jgi:hypothetical protein